MSIRAKILVGCLGLTMLSALLGIYAQVANRRIGEVGLEIYDGAFMAMSYLRAAQLDFTAIRGAAPMPPGQREDLLDDLRVAQDRAISARGRAQAAALRALVIAAMTGAPSEPAIQRAGAAFDRAVEVYADDGFRDRRRVGLLVAEEEHLGLVILEGILAAALLITAVIGRLITAPILRAVRIAQSIAAGRLDNEIVPRGRGETADLLRALATMQGGIAASMTKIRALMDQQAASHASEMSSRNAQMEAALGNMNQGLCLFGEDGRLLTANRRFGEMFGTPTPGLPAAAILRAAGLETLIDAAGDGGVAVLSTDLPDGRAIAVSQQGVAGGGWVATFEDVSERRRAEAELAHVARHDGLTSLPNRLGLGEFLRRLPPGEPTVAVLSLDLDRFKWINDTLGHAVGDALLRQVAERLRACVSAADFVARLGSDEFAVVQVAASQPAASAFLAGGILAALAAPFVVDGQTIEIGASLGIALSDPAAPDPADAEPAAFDTLLKSADLALWRAKAGGGGAYHYFEAAMNTRSQARRRLEQDLRAALAGDGLEAFYQPLIKAGAGICGFEALMRWHHPEHGFVSPGVFIPVAEEIGLIGAMGSWMLRRACQDAAGWPQPLTVAVNLSPLQFRGEGLVAEVARVLGSTGLDPRRLQLEITEGVLLRDDEHVLTILHGLRGLGVAIAMDDFGTGYSSLGYLRRFPFDKIKIDQSFVRQMIERRDCLAIVRAVIGLGRSLGIRVNAEGVETEAQMRALLDEGCGEFQGFLFSAPRPAAEVPAMLERLGGYARVAVSGG